MGEFVFEVEVFLCGVDLCGVVHHLVYGYGGVFVHDVVLDVGFEGVGELICFVFVGFDECGLYYDVIVYECGVDYGVM